PLAGKLLIYDWKHGETRTITLRNARSDCVACGENQDRISLTADEYIQFCNGASADDKARPVNSALASTRLSPQELAVWRRDEYPHLLIDIRPSIETEICRLDNSLFIESEQLLERASVDEICERIQQAQKSISAPRWPFNVVLLCHRGNKSHELVPSLSGILNDKLEALEQESSLVCVRDLAGGLADWSAQVDQDFPIY
ncbi:Molybdenum cofactor synthesis protein 3, partial [Cichlidogyrus casuarinus]